MGVAVIFQLTFSCCKVSNSIIAPLILETLAYLAYLPIKSWRVVKLWKKTELNVEVFQIKNKIKSRIPHDFCKKNA